MISGSEIEETPEIMMIYLQVRNANSSTPALFILTVNLHRNILPILQVRKLMVMIKCYGLRATEMGLKFLG